MFEVFSNPKIWMPFAIAIVVISFLKFGVRKLEKKISDWKYGKKYPASSNNFMATNSSIKSCPKCGGHLKERSGKFGKFLGCSNYPVCRYTQQIK
jgi:hypothetical protein